MKATSLSDLKKKLGNLSGEEILELCLHLAKYKKENKELLTYLLFDAQDERDYIKSIKAEMDKQFEEINKSTIYFGKKGIRKILRMTTKFIKYSGIKQTEIELLIYFLKKMMETGLPVQTNVTITNIYERVVLKIRKSLSTLHEDLQYDYEQELNALNE